MRAAAGVVRRHEELVYVYAGYDQPQANYPALTSWPKG